MPCLVKIILSFGKKIALKVRILYSNLLMKLSIEISLRIPDLFDIIKLFRWIKFQTQICWKHFQTMIIRRDSDLFDRIMGWIKAKAGFKEYWVTVQFPLEDLSYRHRGIFLKVSLITLSMTFLSEENLISFLGAHQLFMNFFVIIRIWYSNLSMKFSSEGNPISSPSVWGAFPSRKSSWKFPHSLERPVRLSSKPNWNF